MSPKWVSYRVGGLRAYSVLSAHLRLADVRGRYTFSGDILDPVVQSIVSLMSSLRVQLIKCFTTL